MSERIVVGAALVEDGRLLAARRSAPVELAGRWELPGGKVEPGETADVVVPADRYRVAYHLPVK